jgi:hypothetical protein
VICSATYISAVSPLQLLAPHASRVLVAVVAQVVLVALVVLAVLVALAVLVVLVTMTIMEAFSRLNKCLTTSIINNSLVFVEFSTSFGVVPQDLGNSLGIALS